MDAAKVPAWPKARESLRAAVRHLGRRRLEKLTEWLTEINLGLKGGNSLPERVQVERLVVMLARPREEAKEVARRIMYTFVQITVGSRLSFLGGNVG